MVRRVILLILVGICLSTIAAVAIDTGKEKVIDISQQE